MKFKAIASRRSIDQRSKVGVVVAPHCELQWHLEKWLRENTSVVNCSSITELKESGELNRLHLVVVVSAHRHSFKQSELDDLILSAPFLPMVCINSEWEDGIARSGMVLNGIVNIHWTAAISYLTRWRNGEVDFLLSRTDSRWEAYGSAPQWQSGKSSIAVTGSDDVAQMWIEALSQAGVDAADIGSAHDASTVLVDWRGSMQGLESQLNTIRSSYRKDCHQQIIVMMHMPRQNLVARLKRLGVSHVLRHPVSLRTVIAMAGGSVANARNEAA